MTKRITIKDVAQHAGMSLATVSGVLNGETRFSEKTTKHVWEVANRLNYMPSASARGLRSGASGERVRTGLIMHIVHMSNVVPFHDRNQETDFYRLSWQARARNLFAIPYCYYKQGGFQCPPLLNDLIDGAIIGTPHLEIVNTVKAKVPVVLMDVPFSMDFVDVPMVNIDHRYDGRLWLPDTHGRTEKERAQTHRPCLFHLSSGGDFHITGIPDQGSD